MFGQKAFNIQFSDKFSQVLEQIASGFFQNESTIYLVNQKIDDAGALALTDAILETELLGDNLYLDLRFNEITDTGAEILSEILKIENLFTSIRIDLTGNKIGAQGTIAIFNALSLRQTSKGIRIDLTTNLVGTQGAIIIADFLETATLNFEGLYLNLSSNNIGTNGAMALAKAISSGKYSSDIEINISHNNIGVEGTDAIVRAVASKECPAGSKINFESFCIGVLTTPSEQVNVYFRLNTSPIRFGTHGNFPARSSGCIGVVVDNTYRKIAIETIVRFFESMHYPFDLRFDISGLNIGSDGAASIARIITSKKLCDRAIHLIMRFNDLGDAGAKYIAKAIESGNFPGNSSIDLRDNNIGNSGAEAIFMAILSKGCPPGLEVFISGLAIDNKAAITFIRNFKPGHCSTRLSLNLNNTHIDPALLLEISTLLERNTIIAFKRLCVFTLLILRKAKSTIPDAVVKAILPFLAYKMPKKQDSYRETQELIDEFFLYKQQLCNGMGLSKLGVFRKKSAVQLGKEQWLVILTNNLQLQYEKLKEVLVRSEGLLIIFEDNSSLSVFSEIILREAGIITAVVNKNHLLIQVQYIESFVEIYGKIDPRTLTL